MQMTNDELTPNDENRENGDGIVLPLLSFGLRYSFVIRHLSFVIRQPDCRRRRGASE
jgi:hypothetical protein